MPTQTRRTAVRRRSAARKAPVEKFTKAEVAFLAEKGDAHRHSEQAWQRLSAPPEEEDRWSAVEESLLARREVDSERGWKYFSK